jgi:hypothetical protein
LVFEGVFFFTSGVLGEVMKLFPNILFLCPPSSSADVALEALPSSGEDPGVIKSYAGLPGVAGITEIDVAGLGDRGGCAGR